MRPFCWFRLHRSGSPRAPGPRRFLLEELESRIALSTLVHVDAAAGRHPINPNIYGLAFADRATLLDLGVSLNRQGGNLASRYNWQQDASNHGLDWFFESLVEGNGTTGNWVDAFIADTLAAGADPVVTIPMIDWIARLGPNGQRLSSFSVAKYGAQQATDVWMPDAGNGVLRSGQSITWNDPADANRVNDAAFQEGWLRYLIGKWGSAAGGGVRDYNLDNEPGLWHETHRDVRPFGVTMEELRDRTIAFARMIKRIDPEARIIGPEEWGWISLFYSGADLQYAEDHGWNGVFPDRQAHGNMDHVPWFLSQMRQAEQTHGQRLLDVFTTHYYPQGGEFSDDVSEAMQRLRNRSTRSLWDPSYIDESWVGDRVFLLPRLQQWVDTYYPGTSIGITEYNWGAERHVNGATTQADVLGILGRAGIERANLWTTPATGTPVYDAFKLYGNYDGQGSGFGDVSVQASVPDPDRVSAFASVRSSDGALTIMIVNKDLHSAAKPNETITLDIGNFAASAMAQRWQLAATRIDTPQETDITRQDDVVMVGNSLTLTVPMQSVTLLVLQPGAPVEPATLEFATSDHHAAEGGQAVLTVRRTGDVSSTVSVQYATNAGTASAGQDYVTTTGTLTFAPGETSKTFKVPILSDWLADGGETVHLTLSNPTGGARLGTQQSATLTIDDVAMAKLRINFTATGSPTPVGFVNDVGLVYGDRGSGLTFGWNRDTRAGTRDRNNWRSPTEMHDSFIFLQGSTNPNAVWEIAVPNGNYQVHLGAGDPIVTTGTFRINVENRLAISAIASSARRWAENTVVVTVSDGRLTVRNASLAVNNKINFIEITPLFGPLVLRKAVNAGGSVSGNFAADGGFTGGQAATTSAAINLSQVAGVAAAVYQSERYGDFQYQMTGLTAGATYLVRLHFAEVYWSQAGQRRFNVKINDAQVLTNFDVLAAAGGKNRAIAREFRAVADATGTIRLDFVSVVNFAKVSGIEMVLLA